MELLVMAKKHWQDTMTQDEIDKLTPIKKHAFDNRIKKGEVICVKPDGWLWGKEECLPNFIIVRVPGVSIEQGVDYLRKTVREADGTIRRKVCNFLFNSTDIDKSLDDKESFINLNPITYESKFIDITV